MPDPRPATAQLDRDFLEIRARLLELAADLDRLDRASGTVADDPRRQGIHKAIEILAGSGPHRAEQLQLVFSRPYDPDWRARLELAKQ